VSAVSLMHGLGHNHRKQRKMLSVVFSTTQMKDIIPTFYEVAHRAQAAITKRVSGQPQELDMLEWSSRLALELIGSAGLGHSFDDFDKEESPSPYIKAVKQYL
jgi:cytochrome P450